MASKELECGPCEYRNKVIPAIVWCSDCAEGLCVECKDHHDAAKVTRAHTCISVRSYIELPKKFKELSVECSLHGERLELYCRAHEAPCCTQCASIGHNQCNGITLLNKAIENIRSSVALESLEQTLAKRIEILDSVTEDHLGCINKLHEQKSVLVEKFRMLRLAFEQGLNKLQSEIESINFTETSKLKNTISTLNSQTSIYKAMQSDLNNIKANGNNHQIYFAIKQMESELQRDNETFKSSYGDREEVQINLSLNSALVPILSEEFSFGSVQVQRAVPNLDVNAVKNGAQLLFSSKVSSIKLKIQLQTTEVFQQKTFCHPEISSVLTLSTGEFVLVNSDWNGGIILFDRYGKFSSKVMHYGIPDKACSVNNYLIAFSFPKNKNIKILYSQMTLCNSIKIYDRCTGLSSADGNIIVSFKKSIEVIDMQGTVLTNIKLNLSLISHIHWFQQKLIVIEDNSDIIWCFDMEGKEIWNHRCKNGVDVRNCCVDKYGNIFASEAKHGGIVFIKRDTRFEQDLICTKELEEPKAITYDETQNLLLVACRKGNYAAVYDINY